MCAALAALAACKPETPAEEPKLDVDETAVVVAATAGEATFNVTANQDWTATPDADWVSLDPATGKASEKAAAVKVTAEDNETTEARTATITVKAGELTKTVKVTQDAGQGQTPEPPGPEDPELSEWALVGSFNGWDPTSDAYLSVLDDEYFVYYGFKMDETTEFKFLKGGAWPPAGQEVGGNGLVEPNTIQSAGGSNIKVTAAGTFDIYLTTDLTKFYIMSEGKLPAEATEPAPVENKWGMMGCFVDNQWASDVPMTKEGEWIVAKGAQFTELTFKIRANSSWSDATNIGVAPGAAKGAVNEKISVVTAEYAKANLGGDAADIKLDGEAGTYDVYFSYENLEVYVMEQGLKPGEKPEPEPSSAIDGKQWLFSQYYVLIDLGLTKEDTMIIALPTDDGSGFYAYAYGKYEVEEYTSTSGNIVFTEYDPEAEEYLAPFDFPYSELSESLVMVNIEALLGDPTPMPFTALAEPFEISFPQVEPDPTPGEATYSISGDQLVYASDLVDGGLYVIHSNYYTDMYWTEVEGELSMTSHSTYDEFPAACVFEYKEDSSQLNTSFDEYGNWSAGTWQSVSNGKYLDADLWFTAELENALFLEYANNWGGNNAYNELYVLDVYLLPIDGPKTIWYMGESEGFVIADNGYGYDGGNGTPKRKYVVYPVTKNE